MPARSAILLVEDSPEDVLIMEHALKKAGIMNRLVVAKDGEEAIEYLSANQPPCLMLLDLKMPKLDGFDVLEWLQKQEGLKRLVVTVLSSSDETRDVNRAYDLGINSYLVKPSSMELYSNVVEKLRDYWLGLNLPPDCRAVN